MSLIRLLPAWLHAVTDYAVGGLLVVAALAVGGSGLAMATGVVVGSVVLLVSALTKYPLGIARVLPFTLHSAGDYLAAALLLGAPFVFSFNDTDAGLTTLYIVAGIAVTVVSVITNYQYSDAAPVVVPMRVAAMKTASAKRPNRPLVADRTRRAS